MSSTYRFSPASPDSLRNDADFYATPFWCVKRLVEAGVLPIWVPGPAPWVELGAGEGNIMKAIQASLREAHPDLGPDIAWTALELREECRPHILTVSPTAEVIITNKFPAENVLAGRRFRVAIMNPPFSLAMDFIKRGLEVADKVVVLLRLNFIGSAERSQFMRDNPPDVYVIPNRPSFTGGGSDSIEYAWFVWPNKEGGTLRVLNDTPAEVRKAEAKEAKAKLQGGQHFSPTEDIRLAEIQ